MNAQEFKKQGRKVGALKRKLGIKPGEKTPPGTFISKSKWASMSKKRKVSVMGLI